MAQKLSIQLALEGAAEIERQLADIGEAGQKAFGEIVQAAKQAGSFASLDPGVVAAKIKKFGVEGPEAIRKIDEAVKAAGRFEQLVSGLKLVEVALNRVGIAGKALTLAFGPLGAVVTILATLFGVALVGAAVKAGEAIAAIDAQAIKLGSTFEAFSKVREGLLRAGIVADSIGQGLEHLQSQIDKVTMARVEQEITSAQKNIAAGWPPTVAGLEFLRKTALGTGAAAGAARKGMETLGRPIQDNVTPLLDAMIRSAGGAVQAIPNLTAELQGMTNAGERARLITGLMDAIQVESGDAVTATLPLLQLLEKMPAGLERNKAASDAFGSAMGTQVAQLLNLGTSISDIITKTQGMAQSQADAGNRIVQTFNQAKGALTGFDQLWGAIATSGAAALGTINSGMDMLIGKLGQAVQLMQQLSTIGGGAGVAVSGFAGGGLIGGRGSGTSDSNLAWLSRGEYIMPAWAVRQPGVLAFLEALRRSGGHRFARGGLVGLPAFAGGGVVEQYIDAIKNFVEEIVASLNSLLSIAGTMARQVNDLARLVDVELTGPGLARGGLMGGRGSGTSDSNLAWVSRGEHIMPARAVRAPGVLAFLEALRRSGGDLRGVLGHLPRFAEGGAVGMNHVTIAFPGLQPIGGLRASGAVVDELRRAAALAQVRSGGRKPSRYS